MFHLKNFTAIKDVAPHKPLDEICPISQRVISLLFRNQSKQIVETNLFGVFGAVDMIGGLEYHHKNVQALAERRSKLSIRLNNQDEERWMVERNVRHEVVAYLNRVGQLFHFADSKWAKQHVPNSIQLVPTISKYKIFRDKHAAHRSIDKPKGEDDSHAQTIQAWGLSSVSAIGFSPKRAASSIKSAEDLADDRELWGDHYVSFQMRDKGKGEFIDFCLELEHPKILAEAFNLVETLVLNSP
jgi:hypothetical protein